MKLYQFIFVSLFSLILACCGGGTSGTDGGVPLRLYGTVKGIDGKSFPSVSVTNVESGNSTTTDSQGKFSIETKTTSNSTTLLLENSDGSAQTQLVGLPSQDSDVTVTLSFDPSNGSIAVLDIEVMPIELPTPQPTISGAPSPAPTLREESLLICHLVSDQNLTLRGVRVTIEGAHNSVTTDSKGVGELNFSAGKKDIMLKLHYKKLPASLVLHNLPTYPVRVEVTIQLKIKSGTGGVGVAGVDGTELSATVENITYR